MKLPLPLTKEQISERLDRELALRTDAAGYTVADGDKVDMKTIADAIMGSELGAWYLSEASEQLECKLPAFATAFTDGLYLGLLIMREQASREVKSAKA